MHQQHPYISRNHVIGHHNVLSPKATTLTHNPYRPSGYSSVSVNNTQSHLIQGNIPQVNAYTQQILIPERNSAGVNRSSHDSLIIPGFFVSTQGERECDFKLAG